MRPYHRIRASMRGCLALLLFVTAAVVQAQPATTERATLSSEAALVFVQFTEEPTAVAYARAYAAAAPGRKAEEARAAGMRQAGAIETQQQQAISQIRMMGISAPIAYRIEHALNGLAIKATAAEVQRLRTMPSVKSVIPIELEYPTSQAPVISNGTSFIGAPKLWENSLGLPAGADGTGIRVGIIDTGLDYQHPHFGGNGVLADYQANDRAVAPDAYFPTARVVGGTDFAGDAYTGSNAAAPDNDPMDCNGHGTHVAGTTGGNGVTMAGAPFTGPFTTAGMAGPFRMQPGVAPKATLYALRVFGCTGATNLTAQAINWAMDPNGDSDLSDHLDVINMSLGSAFGTLSSVSSLAADNAASIGVIVVASAGNNGDTFFVTGSPGAGDRVVATAASADDGMSAGLHRVNSPAGLAGYNGNTIAVTFGGVPPPGGVTGNVVLALDPADAAGPLTTDGCSPLTNAAAIAGNIALIDRGTCGFAIKVRMAQDAGAIGAIIATNSAAAIGNMIGVDDAITIPSIMITQALGNTYKTNIATLNVTLYHAGDTLASFSSRGPRGGIGMRLKPDLAAPGSNVISAQTGVTCTAGACQVPNATGFIAGGAALNLSGTSMAAPHMAGFAALMRQLHPDWTVEEIKAGMMNGANKPVWSLPDGLGDRYGIGRVGAGRADTAVSAVSKGVAYNADDPGTVSVSFSEDFTAASTRTKKVRISNKSNAPVTYDLAIASTNDAPGLSFSLPGGNTLTIPPATSTTIDVMLSANPALMDHVREATVAPTQTVTGTLAANLGSPARHWLTEESGILTFSVSGVEQMRVPLYAVSRPASVMSGPTSIVTGGAPTGSTTIPLTGQEVCTGTLGAGPTCTGTFPTDEVSLASPFELQVVSERDGNLPAFADLQYAGVSYTAGSGLLNFGVSTYGNWQSPTDMTTNIYLDINEDGTWDRILFDGNAGTMGSYLFGNVTNGLDVFISAGFNIATSGVTVGLVGGIPVNGSPATFDNALPRNNVKVISMTPAAVGLTAGDTTFRYKIVTCPGNLMLCQQFNSFWYDEEAGPFFYNYGAQGLDFGGAKLVQSLNGASIPVSWNTANMTTNGSTGALLLQHHNAFGQRAQVIPLDTAQAADLAVSINAAGTLTLGSNYSFTVTATNNGPNASPASTVVIPLPSGLSYVSDNGSGSFNSGTETWTLPALANGASQSLTITAQVTETGAQSLSAVINAPSPLDTNPANDFATVTVANNRSANLAVTGSTSTPTVTAGQPFTVDFVARNLGVDTAYNVLFTATPNVASTPTGGTASTGVLTVPTRTWNLSGLGTTRSESVSLTMTAPSMAGALTTTGTISSEVADPAAGNNSANVVVNVVSPADVSGTLTVTGNFYTGGTVTYTATLTNAAATAQIDNSGDEFSLVLPSTLTLVSASSSSGTAVASVGINTTTWNGTIAASGSVTITVTATVNGTAVAGNTISAQGTINYDANGDGTNEATRLTDDPGVGGASDPTSFVVISPSGVSATKTAAGSFAPGSNITYTITLNNAGPGVQLDNTGDEMTDILPASLDLVSASASSGTAVATLATNTVTWNGAIPAGGSVTVTIVATIDPAATPGSSISNSATVNFDADGNGSNESQTTSDDPAAGGSNDATNVVVSSPSTISSAIKSVSAPTRTIGSQVVYTITINNTGSAQADNAGDEFIDVLPAQLDLVSASASSGTATTDIPNRTVRWNGSIAGGGSVTITITATINAGANTNPVISNQGTVNFDADGNGSNESSIVTSAPSSPPGTPTTFVAVLASSEIPTLSQWGMIAMAMALGIAAWLTMRRA